jgi:hypothetical protein
MVFIESDMRYFRELYPISQIAELSGIVFASLISTDVPYQCISIRLVTKNAGFGCLGACHGVKHMFDASRYAKRDTVVQRDY